MSVAFISLSFLSGMKVGIRVLVTLRLPDRFIMTSLGKFDF